MGNKKCRLCEKESTTHSLIPLYTRPICGECYFRGYFKAGMLSDRRKEEDQVLNKEK